MDEIIIPTVDEITDEDRKIWYNLTDEEIVEVYRNAYLYAKLQEVFNLYDI